MPANKNIVDLYFFMDQSFKISEMKTDQATQKSQTTAKIHLLKTDHVPILKSAFTTDAAKKSAILIKNIGLK